MSEPRYFKVDEEHPLKPFQSEKCPECGQAAVIIRDKESYFKATGWHLEEKGDWFKPFLCCPTDKLFWTYRPAIWKILLMGPLAWPKELRS